MFSSLPSAAATPSSISGYLVFGLLLALIPIPVAGQSPEEMVREFANSSSGFAMVGEVESGSLQADRQITFPVELEANRDYMFVGFCDDDCTDMDLALLGPSGDELESDYLPDAQPVIIFTPERSGRYEVELTMVTCSIEPCAYAAGIFQGDLDEGFGPPGDNMDERLQSFRNDFLAEGYMEVGETEVGTLNEGQEIRFPLRLGGSTEYGIVGVCDNDCENLDLVLYDPAGDEVGSDLLADAFPIISLTDLPAGEYRLAVTMVTCTIEPCGYYVATFARGEGMAPGGMEVSGTIISEATYNGTLEEGDEQLREGEYYDEYSVEANAGQKVYVDLRSPDFDTYLIVEAPGMDAERNDDYGDNTMRSHIEIIVPSDGTVSILVTTFAAESIGDYTLQVVVVEGY